MKRRAAKASAHRLGGRLWTVAHETPLSGTWGHCDHDRRRISVEPNAAPAMMLDTLIHEGLHACCPYLSEEVVGVTATELKDMLLAEGVVPPAGN